MIEVTVRLFSILRHRPDGEIVDRLTISLAEGTTVGDAARQLGVTEDLDIVLAVNDQVVGADATLADGDRIMLIPSVAGGCSSRS